MSFIKHIPNSLTLLNALSGSIGIIQVLDGNIYYGAYFVLISAFLDFLDGFAARLLKVQGELGKQLDSLADAISFGLLPGIVLFAMSESKAEADWITYITLAVPVFSIYRLAKFNLDTRQTDRFIGLPTPASALMITTLPFLATRWIQLGSWLTLPLFLAGIAIVISYLLIAEIPLIALKFKNFSLKDNVYRYLLIILGFVVAIWLGLAGIPFIILAYIGLSIVENSIGEK
ncbi:CDP-diacylglycerol--serine O-phosphatidyltransferase [Algoriphagus sediminis]|uniref:CDP-diacylglycerol--serine O-phosphatidyltransferase n=1 Tax=Algoriphagus sediminis TaxID=3057113 RepID=A0ABT7Y8K7_9BACT|nr:CDP-diacylglycerol--serine O-phosphatidyltransferase [Algoriphagus sediminis]MDN3202846.1 CDP-diacylglycerol--serine O-phosphatidyltransferase [Algoriphagus sediminis]